MHHVMSTPCLFIKSRCELSSGSTTDGISLLQIRCLHTLNSRSKQLTWLI